uniref:Uncharacterized protein n=1 Tax=Acyrthosiphon pisum TaxID=7029 RepID=C4WX35_ACYPI|nr:hypothetical protein [Acyrthosiphon pisum]
MVTLDNGVWKNVSNWENTCSNFTYFSGFIQSTFEKKQIEPVLYCKSFEKSTNIITEDAEDENAEKKLENVKACFNELEEKEFVSYDKKHGLWKNTEHWSTKANNYLYFSGLIKSCLGNLTIGPVLFCNSRSELIVNNTVTYYNSLNKV